MRLKLICFLILFMNTAAWAQQYPEPLFYQINPYLINPGFTGYLTDLSAFVRAQSPLTLDDHVIRNYGAGINKSFERSYIGVGGKLDYDQRDFFESLYVDASLSYKVVFSNKQVLSIGTNVGLANRTYNVDDLTAYVDLSDPTLSSDYYYKTSMNIGIGLAYYSSTIEAGVAMPYMVEGSQSFNGYFNAYLAYKHYMGHDHWILKPNLYMVNQVDGSQTYTGGLMLSKRETFWVQLGGSSDLTFNAHLGVEFGEYRLSYAYVHYLNDDLPYTNLSEIMLQLHFGRSNRVLSHIGDKRNRKM